MTHKILIACEESQRVCEAFRRRGFEAYSCDIIECSGGHPEWHIMGDVLPILNGRCEFYTMDGVRHYIGRQWDLIVAHPPCTFLTNAGARHLYKGGVLNEERYAKGLEAKEFFMRFYTADCPRICIENPTPSRIFALPAASQVIQPYQVGHPYTKRTLLWQINLPPLHATNIVTAERTWCPSGSYSGVHNEKHRGMFTTDRAKKRSVTFQGIADAIAEQYGAVLRQEVLV